MTTSFVDRALAPGARHELKHRLDPAAAAAHPEEADCALYWQNARDRLQAMRDGTAHGDNARAIGRMLEELD